MRLDLVHSRRDFRRPEQLLSCRDGEVAHTNTVDLARSYELLESGPGSRDRHVRYTEALGDGVQGGEGFIGVFECDGPMHLCCQLMVLGAGGNTQGKNIGLTRYKSR